jgi:hypothetical protein
MTSRAQLTFPWTPASAQRVGGRSHRSAERAPRLAPSAVRIPDQRLTELPLSYASKGPQIFVHEGARQTLERRFELRARRPVQLAVTDNRQRIVTRTVEPDRVRVRVHMMFLDAPESVQEALVRYVLEEEREASRIIDRFIVANRHRIRASRPVRGPLTTKGKVHDLLPILASVNDRYLGGSVDEILITWARRTPPRTEARKTIKLGSYSTSEQLIRVHPVLDRKWVPRYFVAYIVYHELLHHVLPPSIEGGRSVVHSPEFLRREREYHNYERALQWERAHLSRLLRS